MIPMITNGQAFLSEFIGTAVLILLGCGVVANAILAKSKGLGGGNLMINVGWGTAVMAGVYFAAPTGGQLNPAVTLGLAVNNIVQGKENNWGQIFVILIAQFLGAFVGAVLCWLAYKDHYDAEPDPANKLGTFSTGPAIRDYKWNFVTEVIATFVLVGYCIVSGMSGHITIGGQSVSGINYGYIGITLLIIGLGASLGGPTGYSMNPARDLSPRIAHAVLPIKGKGDSDWGYAWVPTLGPLCGGILAGLVVPLLYGSLIK